MNKTKLLRAGALIFTFVLLIGTLAGCTTDTKTADVRLGTGGTGGNYYSYGMNLADSLQENSDYSMEVVSTEGSAANLRLLSEGYLDMALVQSDVINDALNGTGTFEDNALTGFHSVTGLYSEQCQIVVLKDSDIQSVEDLKGKRISIGEKDSGVIVGSEAILNAYGITTSDFQVYHLSFSAAATALDDGSIDAFFCTASAPTSAIVDLAEKDKIRILDIDTKITNSMLQSGSYKAATIPAGTYDDQMTDIETIETTAVLVASDDLDPEVENTVLELLQNENENLQEISFGVPAETEDKGILTVSLDMYMTLGLAVLVLFLGNFLRRRIKFLETFCIPAPVIGGLIFAILSCILYVTHVMEFNFDETLKTVCMIIFFTSVGFQANFKVLKQGGIKLVIFLICVLVLIVAQNGIAVGLSKVLNISPLIGLCTGSIPMVGGHGTAGAFGTVLEDLGQEGALSLCTAAATFGLVAGSLMGGPIGRRLILKNDLLKTVVPEDDSILVEDEQKHVRKVSLYAPAVYQLAIAMGLGTIVSMLLTKTGMTFPVYIGSMIVAALMRNIGEATGKFKIHMGEINDIGGICLSLFLGIAMITLKLWQLADLALPLFILLAAQTLFMFLYTYFVVFNVMGRNYDAAVLSAGTCGFGMGATPNAMANMQALTEKFAPSVQAYLLVPIVGSMFADFINSIVITIFINFVR